MAPRRRPRPSRWNAREAKIRRRAEGPTSARDRRPRARTGTRAHRAGTRSSDVMIHFESRRILYCTSAREVAWMRGGGFARSDGSVSSSVTARSPGNCGVSTAFATRPRPPRRALRTGSVGRRTGLVGPAWRVWGEGSTPVGPGRVRGRREAEPRERARELGAARGRERGERAATSRPVSARRDAGGLPPAPEARGPRALVARGRIPADGTGRTRASERARRWTVAPPTAPPQARRRPRRVRTTPCRGWGRR